jgi:hypothetical protein
MMRVAIVDRYPCVCRRPADCSYVPSSGAHAAASWRKRCVYGPYDLMCLTDVARSAGDAVGLGTPDLVERAQAVVARTAVDAVAARVAGPHLGIEWEVEHRVVPVAAVDDVIALPTGLEVIVAQPAVDEVVAAAGMELIAARRPV